MPIRDDHPTLKQLRVFSMVATTSSTLAASAQLLISQPGVSYALDQLEAGLKVRLFDRNRSGCFLTAEGRILQTRAERFLSQYIDAIGEVVVPGEARPEKSEALVRKLRDSQIRALVSIWRAGTFRAAATMLGIAESSLHHPARELEQVLRVSLYRRSANGIEVNATGAELARRFSVAQAEIRYAIEEIGAKPLDTSSNLRIGILALSPRTIIAETTLELLTSSAQPKIQVIEATYDQHVQALRSGDIDLMFSVLRAPLAFEDLVHERLFEDPYVLACGPNHPLARSKTVNPRQLSQYDFVLPPQGFPRRMVIDQALARWHIKANRFVETSCFETVVALLTGSNCVSMLSKWHVEAAGSSLRRLHVKDSKLRRRFMGLTMRQHWLPTGLQREFLKIIRQKTQPMQASLQ